MIQIFNLGEKIALFAVMAAADFSRGFQPTVR